MLSQSIRSRLHGGFPPSRRGRKRGGAAAINPGSRKADRRRRLRRSRSSPDQFDKKFFDGGFDFVDDPIMKEWLSKVVCCSVKALFLRRVV